ncbi:MAG TPA: coproporphyrinogen III oxidase, partial [Flavobacteriaceae bacterium]|nr:coproporphyrinogen III oxidase [Flavobacteriaceae bacterium]
TTTKISELANSPINRLSIGIQSFFDEDLQQMNRAHNSKEAKECLSEATQHFDNITVDLIYGIPNMTSERWKQNLQKVFDFGVNHISSYALTVEPKTALAAFIRQGKYPNASEELALEHFNILVDETEKQGFVHYEISNFGKPDYFSKHNTSYWFGKPYLGIGPSAHSFNVKERSWNVSNNIKYIQAIQKGKLPQEIEELSKNDHFNELVMTGLRTIWGVSLDKVAQDFGIEYKNQLLKNSQEFIKHKLMYLDENERLITTKKGKFLVDGLASDLFVI